MTVTVRYFASISEAIGQGSEAVDTAATTLGALRDEKRKVSVNQDQEADRKSRNNLNDK